MDLRWPTVVRPCHMATLRLHIVSSKILQCCAVMLADLNQQLDDSGDQDLSMINLQIRIPPLWKILNNVTCCEPSASGWFAILEHITQMSDHNSSQKGMLLCRHWATSIWITCPGSGSPASGGQVAYAEHSMIGERAFMKDQPSCPLLLQDWTERLLSKALACHRPQTVPMDVWDIQELRCAVCVGNL